MTVILRKQKIWSSLFKSIWRNAIKIQSKSKGSRGPPSQMPQRELTSKEYYENDNFIDIIEEKENKYTELLKKYKFMKSQHETLLHKYEKVKKEAEDLGRKVEINNKHEEIEKIFSKLSSLILANKTNQEG